MNIENISYDKMSLNRDGQSMLIKVYEEEIDRLNNIINELEIEIDIAIKELQPNELVNGINLLKNIKFTLKELKEE